eukprot:COSAG01_NODE_178_length_22933_cov_18.398529_1_plen_76_part_00
MRSAPLRSSGAVQKESCLRGESMMFCAVTEPRCVVSTANHIPIDQSGHFSLSSLASDTTSTALRISDCGFPGQIC